MSTKTKLVFLIVKIIFGIVSGKLNVIKVIVVNFEKTHVLYCLDSVSMYFYFRKADD